MRSEVFYIPFQGPSTNAIYAGRHWTRRKATKDEAREIDARTLRFPRSRLMILSRPQFVPVTSGEGSTSSRSL